MSGIAGYVEEFSKPDGGGLEIPSRREVSAGATVEVSDTAARESEIPTYADAGIDKRPRSRAPATEVATARDYRGVWLHDLPDAERAEAWSVLGIYEYTRKFAAEERTIARGLWRGDLDDVRDEERFEQIERGYPLTDFTDHGRASEISEGGAHNPE
jgi:hypothetical protein